MKRILPLLMCLLALVALVACASSGPPPPEPGYAGGSGNSSTSEPIRDTRTGDTMDNGSGTTNGGGSSQPTNDTVVGLSATVRDTPQQIDVTTTRVYVIARGPNVDAAEAEGKVEAARAALGSQAVDTIEQDAGWRRAALDNTSTKSLKKTMLSGGVELELVINVFQQKLLEWAREKGYARRVESVAANVPPPEIMIVPEIQAGKWPERLTSEQSLIYSTVQELLAERDIQTYDYQTYFEAVQGELANQTGAAQMDENYLIGGDLYIKFRYEVQPRASNTVNVMVRLQGVLTVTGQNINETTEWSGEISANQVSVGIKNAALKAANKCVTQLLDTYNREYSRGIPYRVTISNVPEDIEFDVWDLIEAACENGRRPSAPSYRDGVLSCVLYAKTADFGSATDFRRYMIGGLRDIGYTLRNQLARSRYIYGELQPR